MFTLTNSPIYIEEETQVLHDKRSGGYASFEGWVRDHNEGKSVNHLEYEAYEALALTEGNKIIENALHQFDIHAARCIHRTGKLNLGEAAVWVGVTAKHRDEAFKACRYIIDTIKHRLPIWKHEFYTDGTETWVNCQGCGHADHHENTLTEDEYYARQKNLPYVGDEGQKKLSRAKVLVVGAGGLGCSALEHLARSGVGKLGIIDFDTIDGSNLHRQTLYTPADIGQMKASTAKTKLAIINPFIDINAYSEKLSENNVIDLFKHADVVLDCTDNFTARFLMNKAAYITNTPVISASVHRFEGRLQVINPKDQSACLHCPWEETPSDDCVGTCQDDGVMGVVPAMLGNLQALEALKLILNLPSSLNNQVVLLDFISLEQHKITLKKNTDCPVCGNEIKIQKKLQKTLPKNSAAPAFLEVCADEVTLSHYHVVDIRALKNRNITLFSDIYQQKQKPLLLVCSRGNSSLRLATTLHTHHIPAYSLKDGIASLNKLNQREGVTV